MSRDPHYLLSAEAGFSAAHTLPGIDMCQRLHGHNWRVRLTVRVPESRLDGLGMGVDFREIERVARDVVADFEHRYLNDLPEFSDRPPTAERVAKVVCSRATERLANLAPAAEVADVEVWETPEYRVVYRPV
ncbi:MAG: 6-carboxytetrahydropterin synthase [Gemmatimonadetes bacterium]|nr:6-carboxytetrahydropterin synthase [Gemmatimonadota bacterium]